MASEPFPRSLHSKAVHGGEARRYRGATTSEGPNPVVGPIHPSVTYTYADTEELDAALAGDPERFVYQRYGNPTVEGLCQAVLELECHDLPQGIQGHVAFATASGMAAVHLALLAAGAAAGSTVVAAQDVYGATYALIEGLGPRLGIRGHFVDATDLAQVEAALDTHRPVCLLVETVSNPLLKVMDIPRLAQLCHKYDARLVVDNTFLTPALYRPLSQGADLVVHSATKFIGGHGDAMGGLVIVPRHMRLQTWDLLKTTGGILDPHAAYLIHRGLKTLPLRMARQCANAAALAEWLNSLAQVERVYYPGLPDHPQHELARRLFGQQGYGAMLAFELRGATLEDAFRFLEALQMIQPATSLGDVYTLAMIPAHASHRALRPEARAAIGIRDGLVRLSVGIEDLADIQADLAQAMACLRG